MKPATLAAPAVLAVEADVVLAVVPGTMVVSIDEAVNRLGAIQDAERALDKEKKPLRDAAEYALRRAGLDTYSTAEGRSVTVYEQGRSDWDADYLASILTPDQLARAKRSRVVQGLRVR